MKNIVLTKTGDKWQASIKDDSVCVALGLDPISAIGMLVAAFPSKFEVAIEEPAKKKIGFVSLFNHL